MKSRILLPILIGLVLVGTTASAFAQTAPKSAATGKDLSAAGFFARITDHYLAIQSGLAADSAEGAASHATAIAQLAHDLGAHFTPDAAGVAADQAGAARTLLPDLTLTARKLALSTDLATIRAAFGPLSDALIAYRGLVAGAGPHVAYCSMADRSWLQTVTEIANPYYGSAMLRCGAIVKN